MTDNSERRLVKTLAEYGWYATRVPASGAGVTHPETGDKLNNPDIVAISEPKVTVGNLGGESRSRVVFIEEKNVEYPYYISDADIEQLMLCAEQAGAEAYYAIQKKYTKYPHEIVPTDYLLNNQSDDTQSVRIDETTPTRPLSEMVKANYTYSP